MAIPVKSLIFPDPGSLRYKYYAFADVKWRREKPPPRQSRFKSLFEELERQEDTRRRQEILKPKKDAEPQEDRQAKDCRMEEEPATFPGGNDVHDEDNETLNHNQGNIVRNTSQESANGSQEEAVNDAHMIPVDSNCENQSLDGTHEEPDNGSNKEALNGKHRVPADANPDNQFLNGTH